MRTINFNMILNQISQQIKQQLSYPMLFRKSTCWSRQASLRTDFHTSFDVSAYVNGRSNKTQTITNINNNRIMKEVGKKYIVNVQELKSCNLDKMVEEGKNRNGVESNQVPINQNIVKIDLSLFLKQLLKRRQEQLRQEASSKQENLMKTCRFSGICTLAVASNFIDYFVTNKRQQQKLKSMTKQSSNQIRKKRTYSQEKKNPELIILDNQIYNQLPAYFAKYQLKQIIVGDFYGDARAKIVINQPKKGKKTLFQKLYEQLRDQGHIVHSHNFTKNVLQSNPTNQQSSREIFQLHRFPSMFYNKRYRFDQEGKFIYLLMDSINLLEVWEKDTRLEEDIYILWRKLAYVSQLGAIAISSSNAYVKALKQKSYVTKESALISRSKTKNEMKQAIKNIFDFNPKGKQVDSSRYEQTIQYLAKQRQTLRQVMNVNSTFNQFKGDPDDKSFLQKHNTKQKKVFNKNAQKQANGQKNQNKNNRLLQEMIKLKQQNGENGYFKAQAALKQIKISIVFDQRKNKIFERKKPFSLLLPAYREEQKSTLTHFCLNEVIIV